MADTTTKARWAPRVRREKLKRLYESDAQRIVDEDLLDDVGITLYCRCRDILIVSDAAEGRVKCGRCAQVIAHRGGDKAAILTCAHCGWSTKWGDYQRTYQHHELYARGLTEEIHHFMEGWERAADARTKMLLIDRLIHAWHWEARNDHPIGRPAAVNLIEGSRKQVLEFLEELGNTTRKV